MFRFLMIIGLLFGMHSTQAEAKTISYEFDVVGSRFSVGTLYESSRFGGDGTRREIGHADPFYQEIMAAGAHSWSNLMGQTGHVAMRLHGDEFDLQTVDCHSGFLCSDLNRMSAFVGSTAFDLTGFRLMSVFGLGEWYLRGDPVTGEGSLSLVDGASGGGFYLNNNLYEYGMTTAGFNLRNLTITEIAPVPLPAAAPLLAIGLLTLGIGARRRSRIT